jgi:membrane protease YdiL (CAAX protease family)
MKTGFWLVDGDPERGIPAATPRHWVLCAAFVIVAQWVFGNAIDVTRLGTALVLTFGGYGDWQTPFSTIAWLIFPFALVAWIAVWLSRRYDGRGFNALGVNARALAGAAPWVLAGVLISGLTIGGFFLLSPGWERAAGEALLWFVPATIIQAGAEEIVFRGALLSMLVARYGAWRGVLISSLLFAMWHLYSGQNLIDAGVYAVMTFVMGLGFAILALHQGHLGGVIALHVVWNVVADVQTGLTDWTGANGILGMFDDFWTSYAINGFAQWTLADLQSQETLRNTVLPLILETLIILAACRTTVEKMLTRQARVAGEVVAD